MEQHWCDIYDGIYDAVFCRKLNTFYYHNSRLNTTSTCLSLLSIANQSSQPTVSQLKCVSDTISNGFENHQPQKTKLSTVIYAHFIQNSNKMASRLTATTSFPRVFFQLLQFSRQRPSFSAHRAALLSKTDLIFPAFSSRFLKFAVQFCFRVATLESGLTVA